jgi:hypothetical protein
MVRAMLRLCGADEADRPAEDGGGHGCTVVEQFEQSEQRRGRVADRHDRAAESFGPQVDACSRTGATQLRRELGRVRIGDQ